MLLFTETIPKFLRPFRKNQVSLIYFLTNERGKQLKEKNGEKNGERERGRGKEGGREGEREGEGEGEGDRQRKSIQRKRERVYIESIQGERESIQTEREREYIERKKEREKKNSLKIANFLK